MEVPYIDTRLRDGTILDVLHKHIAKVGGARAKATRCSGSQYFGYESRYEGTKSYEISPGIVISRPATTDILYITIISHYPIGQRILIYVL